MHRRAAHTCLPAAHRPLASHHAQSIGLLPCRYKCAVCEDIDLCGACMRALVAARVKMSQEAAPRPAPPRQVGGLCGDRRGTHLRQQLLCAMIMLGTELG